MRLLRASRGVSLLCAVAWALRYSGPRYRTGRDEAIRVSRIAAVRARSMKAHRQFYYRTRIGGGLLVLAKIWGALDRSIPVSRADCQALECRQRRDCRAAILLRSGRQTADPRPFERTGPAPGRRQRRTRDAPHGSRLPIVDTCRRLGKRMARAVEGRGLVPAAAQWRMTYSIRASDIHSAGDGAGSGMLNSRSSASRKASPPRGSADHRRRRPGRKPATSARPPQPGWCN